MPATRVRARAVVEHEVTLGSPTATQPAPIDRPQLKRNPPGHAGHKGGVGPFQTWDQLDCRWCLEQEPSSAWLSERCDTRCLPCDFVTTHDAINELDDNSVQLPQSVQIRSGDSEA